MNKNIFNILKNIFRKFAIYLKTMNIFFGFLIAYECNYGQPKVDNTRSWRRSGPGCYLIGAGEPRPTPPPRSTSHLRRGGLMMVSPVLRCLSSPPFLFFCCLLLLQLPICRSIYCDEDDCYDLLGWMNEYPSPFLFISLDPSFDLLLSFVR